MLTEEQFSTVSRVVCTGAMLTEEQFSTASRVVCTGTPLWFIFTKVTRVKVNSCTHVVTVTSNVHFAVATYGISIFHVICKPFQY